MTFFPAIILLSSLSGCVAASETLSASETTPDSASPWNGIHIGVTTQDEIRSRFGQPTDIQVSQVGDGTHEAWAYVSANAARQPFQYLPFFGSLATITPGDQKPFTVSFSEEGIVDGLTVSPFQVQGNNAYNRISFHSDSTQPTYGMKNPQVQQFDQSRVR
ncbi:MAG: hypothetical protein ACPGYT_00835 [Nitrospirales bacterium]